MIKKCLNKNYKRTQIEKDRYGKIFLKSIQY